MGITPQNPADFDPAMGNYKDLSPFRFWCQKVLPLVYDDSLSYYEVLCKLVDYLNKTMEDVGVLHEDVEALHTAYQELQKYVNNYFDSLDVQEEINNKLDTMASDGTLDALLLPYFNAYKNEINNIIDTQNQNIANQAQSIAQNSASITQLAGRMDNYERLPDGSTTGDAELIDIRTGADGFTYSNAGTAVRRQFEKVRDTTDKIKLGNLFDGETWVSGYYANSGSLVSSNTYKNMHIPVKEGDVIRWKFEDINIENQNGIFMLNNTFVRAFSGIQTKVDNTYYQVIVPAGVDTAYVNFKTPVSFIIVKNTPYDANVKYGNNYFPSLDVSSNLSDLGVAQKVAKIQYGNLFDGVNFGTGYYSNGGTLVPSDTYKHTSFSVTKGDVIRWSYETIGLEHQNGIFMLNNVLAVPFDSLQVLVNDEYYEITVPSDVDTAIVNFRSPESFVFCKNSTYKPYLKYGKTYIHDLDVETNIAESANNIAITEKVNNIYLGNQFDGETYENGYYSNSGSFVPHNMFKTTPISVNEGDVLRWSYETPDLQNQNGIFMKDNVMSSIFRYNQVLVDNTYYEITVPANADTAWINFKSKESFVVIRNSFFLDYAKYGKLYMPDLDVSRNSEDDGIAKRNDVNYASIFRKVCCIGDSITEGYYGDSGGTVYGTYPDYCYPSFLAKLIDADVKNMGVSGWSAQNWYQGYATKFDPSDCDWTKYDAFIIFLGTNGGISGDCNTDPDNTSQMGYYCRIIEMILEDNPQASIFLCTSPWTQNRDVITNFTSQIVLCGETYNLPVLRLDQSEFLTYNERLINQPYDHVLHFGRAGLMRMASEIARCINDNGRDNPGYFNKLYGYHY